MGNETFNIDDEHTHAELIFLRAQVKELNEKLKKSESYKSNFISNVRNEIINPITGVLGLSQALFEDNSKSIDKKSLKKIAHLIYEEVFELQFQLNSLIYAASVESGDYNLSFQCIALDEFFDNIRTELDLIVDKSNVKLEIKIHHIETIVGDSDKLKLISSLFIYFLAKQYQFEGSLVVICEPDVEKVKFQFYHQTQEGANEQHDFTGIEGLIEKMLDVQLSTARSLIELMGGDLKVAVVDNKIKGFTFGIDQHDTSSEEGLSFDEIIF